MNAIIDPAIDALLTLAVERPWRHISLRGIALTAEVPFAELYDQVPSKLALLARLSRRLDAAAFRCAGG